MAFGSAPPFIEQTDFSGGYQPDIEPAAVPPHALSDVMNLLPDVGSGTPQVRAGFKRIASLVSGYTVTAIHPYSFINGSGVRKTYLMVVVSTLVDNVADNLRVYSLDLQTGTGVQRSPTNKTWVKATGVHWGETINGIFYGGSAGNPMYSWNGTTVAWNDDAGAHDYKELVLPTSGINLTTEVSADKAFKKRAEVQYEDPLTLSTQSYRTLKDIFYKKWSNAASYQRGDRVSIRREWFTGKSWYKSYHCKKKHDADATNRPGDGSGNWQKYWRLIDLDLPRDDESEINADHWSLIPEAAATDVAAWHGQRLFMRYDDLSGQVGQTRVLYSAPSRFKKGQAITDLTWDPKDFGPEDDQMSTGGGFFDIETGSNEPITAMAGLGYSLLIFTRHSAHALTGLNESTWNLRPITGQYGAIGPRATCVFNNQVYFFSDLGLATTDGSFVEEVENGQVIREWLRSQVNWDRGRDVVMWAFDGLVWVSLPSTEADTNDRVIAYDPETSSFWKLDLAVATAAVTRIDGVDQLFFGSSSPTGTLATAVLSWTGTPHRSTSTRVIGGVTRTNRCTSPNFGKAAGEDPRDVKANSGWAKTTADKVSWHVTSEASFRGVYGATFRNDRTNPAAVFEGLQLSFADGSTGTQTISCFIRRANSKREKKPPLDYSYARFRIAGSDLGSGVHTYRYVGRGWWRMSATFTGSLSARTHAVVIRPDREAHLDCILSEDTASLLAYFDGKESMGDNYEVFGGKSALVYQYDHKDILGAPTDDTGETSYAGDDIRWHLRSAWWTFSAARQDRRIRRSWAMLRGAVTTMFRGFRNHGATVAFETAKSSNTADTSYHEGAVMPDSYAVGFVLEGTGAPAAVLGLGIDTEPRRQRYHTPAPTIS